MHIHVVNYSIVVITVGLLHLVELNLVINQKVLAFKLKALFSHYSMVLDALNVQIAMKKRL